MNEGGSFNITNTLKPTNQDIVVAFSPAQNTVKYTYTILKNNIVISNKTVEKNEITNINLNETGNYNINVKTYNNEGKENIVNSGTYQIDKEPPTITINNPNITIKKGEGLPDNIINATDNYSNNLEITNNAHTLNLNETGQKTLTYTVTDEAGNMAQENINITVQGINTFLFIAHATIVILAVLLLTFIIKIYKNLKVIKRIEPFTIISHRNKELSLADKTIIWYQNKLKNWRSGFEKSDIAKRYSKKLEKYTEISSVHKTGMDIFISKILFSIILLILAFIVKALTFKILTPYEILLPLLVGFFFLDIIYFIKYRTYRNKLENDLLSAIIVMNNAFKSGRSITQAIDIVSKEIKGEIGKEFSKMSLELAYGLGIDTVFKRFAERIKLDEVNYLTASLTILNKTGGNIIEVFSSIEKTLFNKKKLRLELKSLTSSSRIIVYVLFTVPFLFVLFISIISPGYFSPFITTSIGRIILTIIIIYYIIFVIAVRKIMKVVI